MNRFFKRILGRFVIQNAEPNTIEEVGIDDSDSVRDGIDLVDIVPYKVNRTIKNCRFASYDPQVKGILTDNITKSNNEFTIEGDNANAVKYINDLRKRAGRVDANATSISLNDVFTEISRELMWEGQRRTILIRFDKFTSGTYLWRLKGGVKNGQALPDYRKLFPLPSDDVLANSNLKQNAGYTE